MARFLLLRGFVDENHELTVWGRALRKAVLSLEAPGKLEESVYLAMEMLRFEKLDDTSASANSANSKIGKRPYNSSSHMAKSQMV